MSKSRPRRKFTPEYMADAVALVQKSGKSITAVAKDLDLTPSALARWIEKAEGRPEPAKGKFDELSQLREENRMLRLERDFLKKAAAFFAKQTT
jgi:transposase